MTDNLKLKVVKHRVDFRLEKAKFRVDDLRDLRFLVFLKVLKVVELRVIIIKH